MYTYLHWHQTGWKSGGAEWEFKTYSVKFETYSVLQDYETKKTTGAPAPAAPTAPASLAPMYILQRYIYIFMYLHLTGIYLEKQGK